MFSSASSMDQWDPRLLKSDEIKIFTAAVFSPFYWEIMREPVFPAEFLSPYTVHSKAESSLLLGLCHALEQVWLELIELANENTGLPGQFELHINKRYLHIDLFLPFLFLCECMSAEAGGGHQIFLSWIYRWARATGPLKVSKSHLLSHYKYSFSRHV